MDSAELHAVQEPLKDAYRSSPHEALVTLRARGQLEEQAVACSVATGRELAVAGLHPATGVGGSPACSRGRPAPSPPRWIFPWPGAPSPPKATWTSAAPWP